MAEGFDRAESAAHFSGVAKAFGGFVQNALDQLLGDAREPLALFRLKIFHFAQPLAQ